MVQLKVAGFAKNSIVDGPGIRYVIFTQGCYHKCEGCQNPQTHNPNEGKLIDINEILDEILGSTMIEGVTFSGGEPFLQADALAELAVRIKRVDKSLSIICYTGYTYEELTKIIESGVLSYFKLLSNVDYLIDGRFEQDKASLNCNWRGSTNQRIIDVKQSLAQKTIVEVGL